MTSDKSKRSKRTPTGRGRAGRSSEAGTGARAKATKADALTRVELRILEINCIKTTKELGKDEIILSAVQVEGKLSGTKGKYRVSGKARAGKTLSAHKFQKGDKVTFTPPELIAQFPLGDQGDKWPRTFLAVLVMIEKDEGAVGFCLDRIVSAFDKKIVETVTEAAAQEASESVASTLAAAGVGAVVGGLVVPLVGPMIGAAAGRAVSAALAELKKAKADDVFPRQEVVHELQKYPAQAGEILRGTANFEAFKGHYRVVYSLVVA